MQYMTMAQACGEAPILDTGWVPGVDFDPYDTDEMEVMDLVWQRERADSAAVVRRENTELRARLAAMDPDFDGDAYLNAQYDDAL
jgi:hypothetical protein